MRRSPRRRCRLLRQSRSDGIPRHLPGHGTGNIPLRPAARHQQHRRVPCHRPRPRPAPPSRPHHDHIYRQPQRPVVDQSPQVPHQISPHPPHRASISAHRARRTLARHPRFQPHPPAEMGNQAMGRSPRRLRPQITPAHFHRPADKKKITADHFARK